MRASLFFLATLKEAPHDAELISHVLMVRAGFIKRLGAGLYTWMPLGLRVLRKVERIIREEMNKTGALEVLMPAVQPKELWEETGRWAIFGPQMLKLKDRHDNDFCFGPTHEEVVTDVVRREISSYKQLPIIFYQIQTKFRDEIRPRFGVMRAREFIMKDAYSFHTNLSCLEKTYQDMYRAYSAIFTRLGLNFRAVKADTGVIGGENSHEFHVLADSGEDELAYCDQSDYAANVELATTLMLDSNARLPASASLELIATPNQTKCIDLSTALGIPLTRFVKTIALVSTRDDKQKEESFCLALVRADHVLNQAKLSKYMGFSSLRLAHAEEVMTHLQCPVGFIGPVGVSVEVIVDNAVAMMNDFVCGANKVGYHCVNVNFERDLPEPRYVADIRNVVAGDLSPDGKGKLLVCRGIEVGHIFQLKSKYSERMQANYLDINGETQVMQMGCYGIGVSRIVAATIEQNHDKNGMVLPPNLAPFMVVLCPIAYTKSAQVKKISDNLYQELLALGIDVLLDDRDERPGVMFADADLIGVPHRITIGERGLANNTVEYKARHLDSVESIPLTQVVPWLKQKII